MTHKLMSYSLFTAYKINPNKKENLSHVEYENTIR